MLTEIYGSRETEYTDRGASATRLFIGDWTDWRYFAPKPGQPYPEDDRLLCTSIQGKPTGKGGVTEAVNYEYEGVRVTCKYTFEYDKPQRFEAAKISCVYDTDVQTVGMTRKWSSDNKTIAVNEIPMSFTIPKVGVLIDVVMQFPPFDAIMAAVGKLNNADFSLQGYTDDPLVSGWTFSAPYGCLLLNGVQSSASYDVNLDTWFFRMQFNCTLRTRDHNIIWRPQRILKDEWGENIWDKAVDDWSYDPASTAMYDLTSPLLYDYASFDPLFIGGGNTPIW